MVNRVIIVKHSLNMVLIRHAV